MKILPTFRAWLKKNSSKVDAITLDVDGVLANGRILQPGAAILLESLRAAKTPFVLLTNDGCNSPVEKVCAFRKYGLKLFQEEIVSTSHAIEEFAQERDLVGKKAFIMGSLGNPSYASAAGLVPVTDFAAINKCKVVIMGEKKYDWQRSLDTVINFLANNPDIPLVVPNPDAYYLDARKNMRLAPGALARLIDEILKDRKIRIDMTFLGKPHARIFRHSHKVLEKRFGRPIEKNRVMMVGDSLLSDVTGAKGFGYSVALVLTGVTTRHMLKASKIKPDLIFKNL